MIISCTATYWDTAQRLLIHGLMVCLMSSICYTPLLDAGMPQLNAQELAEFEKFMQDLDKPEMQQFIKEFETEFNKLPPEVQEELNKQAMEDLKRMGIDPYSYQPMMPATPQPLVPSTPQHIPQPALQTPAPTLPPEPISDCSPITTHSLHQASSLLQNTISYLEIVRQKLGLIALDTTTTREWLSTIAYYLKMINKPEHIKRLTSVTFTHLFDLLIDIEGLLRTEAAALIILAGEEESRSDDPYAILGVPYDATSEEITKAYQQKFAEHDPATIKKELEALHADAHKINKRVRQAKLRQATLVDAYEQLQDPKLRQQLDRYRSNTHQQRTSLHTANEKSIERLHTTLQNLIGQGLIKELEDFFSRYAPSELTYHQRMEDAEKERLAEQRPLPPALPLPTPLGGGFPYGGYQPSYYPTTNYFPPYQPTFTPQPTIPGGAPQSGGGAVPNPSSSGGAQPTGANNKSGKTNTPTPAPKKEPAKEESKKTTKKKKRKMVDGVEQITKEFTKHLNNLKEPMNNFKDYIQAEEQGGVRTLDTLSAPLTRAGKSITDESFKSLHEGLKRHINPGFIDKFETIRKFAIEKLIPNQVPHQKAIDACRSIWEKHHKEHAETYKIFSIICKHVLEAVEKNRALVQQIPWNNVLAVCQTIEGMKELFKRPNVNAAHNAPTSGKKENSPPLPMRPSVKERDQQSSGKEKEKKESTAPTAQDVQNAVYALKAGCDAVEKTLQQQNIQENFVQLKTNLSAALANNNVEEVRQLKTHFDNLCISVGFNELTQAQSFVKKLHKALLPADKEATAPLMKQVKICKKAHPALYEIQMIKKAIKEFLR